MYTIGDLKNEDSVLEWLSDDENRELADEIEAVNSRMLERLLDESPFLAVFFCKYFACRLTLVAITTLNMFPSHSYIKQVVHVSLVPVP